MTVELHERVRALEEAAKEIPVLKAEVSALKRFQVSVMTAISVVGAIAAYFADALKKKFGF